MRVAETDIAPTPPGSVTAPPTPSTSPVPTRQPKTIHINESDIATSSGASSPPPVAPVINSNVPKTSPWSGWGEHYGMMAEDAQKKRKFLQDQEEAAVREGTERHELTEAQLGNERLLTEERTKKQGYQDKADEALKRYHDLEDSGKGTDAQLAKADREFRYYMELSTGKMFEPRIQTHSPQAKNIADELGLNLEERQYWTPDEEAMFEKKLAPLVNLPLTREAHRVQGKGKAKADKLYRLYSDAILDAGRHVMYSATDVTDVQKNIKINKAYLDQYQIFRKNNPEENLPDVANGDQARRELEAGRSRHLKNYLEGKAPDLPPPPGDAKSPDDGLSPEAKKLRDEYLGKR